MALTADELSDELLQLVLIVPAGKCRGQVELGTCRARRLLQHLGREMGGECSHHGTVPTEPRAKPGPQKSAGRPLAPQACVSGYKHCLCLSNCLQHPTWE